uniref:hypothetical protein n=1 Tax=Candidatus Electronema sp. TaxID=2698783 RepID=UPI004056EB6F
MGDITIRIPQQIHIEYTLKSASMAKRILDFINVLIFRDAAIPEQQADSGNILQLSLGDLALQCFGPDAGVDLELPERTPHQPLEMDQ